jgi:hypothetical protein
MNKREAAIVSAFTGYLLGDFSDMHKYAEEIMSGPIWTHQFGDKQFTKKLKAAAKPDYIDLSDNLVETDRIEELEAREQAIRNWADKWGPTDMCQEALVELELLLENDDE